MKIMNTKEGEVSSTFTDGLIDFFVIVEAYNSSVVVFVKVMYVGFYKW
jgi:hypothetical protein